jgi:uncharacterized protein YdeI (YjbR/CyaY-like superfamily)
MVMKVEFDMPAKPLFFATPSKLRAWLERNHAKRREALVGFYKRGSGKPSITWPESVDQALCFGWIDGVRKRIDDVSYSIRFTPRKAGSNWSSINVKRVKQLETLVLMRPPGLAAFEKRVPEKSGIYSYEQRKGPKLDAAGERRFRASPKAWSFFQGQAPWYRRTAIFWVVSAKREETRQARLSTLIGDSERGRSIPPLLRPHGSAR